VRNGSPFFTGLCCKNLAPKIPKVLHTDQMRKELKQKKYNRKKNDRNINKPKKLERKNRKRNGTEKE
jgi:hypothetical protein